MNMNQVFIKNTAFSLLEMAMVLTIIGLLVSSSLIFTTNLESSRVNETKQKLEVLEKAIASYVLANQRLPCPSNIAEDVTALNSGSGDCDGSSVYHTTNYPTPTGYNNTRLGADLVYIGAIPVKDLGLPNSYMIDGWDNKFTYAVSGGFVIAEDQYANFMDTNYGIIRVTNTKGVDATGITTVHLDKVAYVLVSHGSNGYGAFPKSASSIPNPQSSLFSERYNSLTTSLDFVDEGGTLVEKVLADTPGFVVGMKSYEGLDSFGDQIFYDDIVRYKSKDIIVASLGYNFADIDCVRAYEVIFENKARDFCFENNSPAKANCETTMYKLGKAVLDRCLSP